MTRILKIFMVLAVIGVLLVSTSSAEPSEKDPISATDKAKSTTEKFKEHISHDRDLGVCIGTKEFKVCSNVDAGNLFKGEKETTGYSVGVMVKFEW